MSLTALLQRLYRLFRCRPRRRSAAPAAAADHFTEAQQQIITLHAGRHLVLAPPGSGKTELLAQRILWALGQGIAPEKMLGLTFTIRAARNMETRIAQRSNARLPLALGNLHHFCAALLRRRGVIPSSWLVIDEATQHSLLDELLAPIPAAERKLLLDHEGRPLLRDIANIIIILQRQALDMPAPLAGEPHASPLYQRAMPLFDRLQQEYQTRKERFHVVDYDDILNLAYLHLVRDKGLPESDKFTWIQVDEVQDLNPLQWEIIRGLQAPAAHCVYLGDLDQAIFSFMGASPDYLRQEAATCRIHHLNQNFRSPPHLVALTTHYATANLTPQWLEPPVAISRPAARRGELRAFAIKGNYHQEQEFLVRHLQQQAARDKAPLQTAILLRDNQTAEAYATALQQAGLPTFKLSGDDLLQSELCLDLKAHWSSLLHSNDLLAWSRLLRCFAGLPSQRSARNIAWQLQRSGLFLVDLLPQPLAAPSLTDAFAAAVAQERLVVFDTETTGLDMQHDDIIQLAAVELCHGRPGRSFALYLKTARPLGDSSAIHQITAATLASDGVPPAMGLQQFLDFVGDAPLVAHNALFDTTMLHHNLRRHCPDALPLLHNRVVYDTLEIARRLLPDLPSHRLARLIEALQLPGSNSHDARDDAAATLHLALALQELAGSRTAAQRQLIERHHGILQAWRTNFAPLWEELNAAAPEPTTWRHLTGRFLHHVAKLPSLQFDVDEALSRLAPLLDYLEAGSDAAPLQQLLRRSLPHIIRLKESDLLRGSEPFVVATIHKAKGLEFDRVVIPRCNDGVYPHHFSRLAPDPAPLMAEDARLLYVALTRAKSELLLSWPTRHRGAPIAPSPFILPLLPRLKLRSV